jgi:pSer/pThr/pTyr-binding forkhead associated (FHA) protein
MSSQSIRWLRLTVVNLHNEYDPYYQPQNQKRYFECTPHTEITFGRLPTNNIHLPDSAVSSQHARIFVRGDELLLQDLGSSNGTKFRGRQLKRGEEVEISHGDKIELINYTIQLHTGDSRQELEQFESSAELMRDLLETVLGRAMVEEEVPPRLIVESDPHRGQTMELRGYGRYRIGRSRQCHMTINDQNISREHMQISRDLNGITVSDLNSRNGIKLNGVRLRPENEYTVKHGDNLMLGALSISLQDPEGAQFIEKITALNLDPEQEQEVVENVRGIPMPDLPRPSDDLGQAGQLNITGRLDPVSEADAPSDYDS